MNALHFFWGFGAFLSPLIVAWAIARSGDIGLAYVGLAALVAPPIVWLLRVRGPDRPAGTEEGSAGPTANSSAPAGLVIIIMAFLFLYVGAEVAFGGWIYTYALTLGLADATMAAYLTSAFWGSLTLGRLVSIPLARFKPATVLLADMLGCVAGASVVLLAGQRVPLILLGSFVFGFSMASIFPTLITFAGSLMAITGKVTGWFLVGASAGGMTVPWLIGQLFEPVGPQITMLIIMADMLIALLVFAVLRAAAARHALASSHTA